MRQLRILIAALSRFRVDKKWGKGKDKIDDEDITFQRMVAKVSRIHLPFVWNLFTFLVLTSGFNLSLHRSLSGKDMNLCNLDEAQDLSSFMMRELSVLGQWGTSQLNKSVIYRELLTETTILHKFFSVFEIDMSDFVSMLVWFAFTRGGALGHVNIAYSGLPLGQ